VRPTADRDAVARISQVERPGGVGPQGVVLDQVAPREVDLDCVAHKTVDRQAADRAPPGGAQQAVGPRTGEATVKLYDWCAGVIGLGGAVDHNWIGDRRQRASRLNRVWTGTGNTKLDDIGHAGGEIG